MAVQRWALVVSQKQEIPFFSGSWSCPAAAVTRRMTRGGQTDGPEIRLSDAARASRTCRQQPAERPEALAAGLEGLFRDATRPPGRKPVPEGQVKALIALAMSPPPPHARHWRSGGRRGRFP